MQAARGASLTPGDPGPESGPATPRSGRRSVLLLAGVAATAYAADQVTKLVALDRLEGRAPVPVVGDLLQLVLVRNPGAAFGTGSAYTEVLAVVAVVAAVVTVWFARRVRTTGWAIALGLLLAGIVGNLTDRLLRSPGVLRGEVVDFLALPHWPVFNVADVCIDVGAVLIVAMSLRGIHLDGTREDRTSAGEGRRGGRARHGSST